MAKIDLNQVSHGADTISVLCSFGLICGLIVTVLGIKFKWFKHRLTFDQVPNNNKSSQHEQYKQSTSIQGVFRRKFDEDNEIIRPKSLPPVRVRKSSKSHGMLQPNRGVSINNEISSTTKSAIEPKEENSSKNIESVGKKSAREQQKPKKENIDDAAAVAKVHSNNQSPTNESTDVQKNIKKRTKKRTKLPDIENEIDASREADTCIKEGKKEYDSKKNDSKKTDSKKTDNKKNDNENEKRNFVEYENSEKANITFEKLKEETDNDLKNADIAKRRPTGIIRPNIEEKKDKVVTFEETAVEDEDEFGESLLSQRRPTQYTSSLDPNELQKPDNASVILKLEGFSDNDEELEEKPIERPTPKTRKQEISSQEAIILATNLAEMNPDDSWSAIQRHRNLTQELTKQHQATKSNHNKIKNGNNEYRNPLATTQSKPKTMRDMKKSKEKPNDVMNLGNSEDTEA